MDGTSTPEDDPTPPGRLKRWWQKLLDQKMTGHRLLLVIGGIAGAVVSIGTVVITLAGWFGGDDGGGAGAGAGGGERVRSATAFAGHVVESGTDEGDDLVRFLLAASGGDPLGLDFTVRAPDGFVISSHLVLWYNCAPGAVVGSGACNRVRLEFPSDIPVQTLNPLGWRFRGTYRVTIRTGVDYGTDLDISFDDIST